eukprot:92421-Rhodomonas_salina.2
MPAAANVLAGTRRGRVACWRPRSEPLPRTHAGEVHIETLQGADLVRRSNGDLGWRSNQAKRPVEERSMVFRRRRRRRAEWRPRRLGAEPEREKGSEQEVAFLQRSATLSTACIKTDRPATRAERGWGGAAGEGGGCCCFRISTAASRTLGVHGPRFGTAIPERLVRFNVSHIHFNRGCTVLT